MLKIQKAVKIPPPHRPNVRAKKYPFAEMEVGEMFFVPEKTKNTMSPYASSQGTALGRKFTTRIMSLVLKKDGEWREPKGNEEGVVGIGVFREE